MQGALEDITKAVGNTPIVRLNRVTQGVAAEIYVKCEYLNPGGSHKDRVALNMIQRRRGGGAQAGRHDRRGDERQHRRVARAARRDPGLQVRLRHARQDVAGEDLEPARVRRAASSCARPPSSPTIRAATTRWPSASPRRRPTASTRTSTTTPRTPKRTTSRPGPEIWEQTRRRARRLRRRHGHRRHHQRRRQVPQGEEARTSSSSASIRSARSTTTS